jgi:hypothetical protein
MADGPCSMAATICSQNEKTVLGMIFTRKQFNNLAWE